jgi:hypothetical protein
MWRIVSENNFSLKNGDYFAMLKEGDNPNILPNITPSIVTTGEADPIISGLKKEMGQLVATISIDARDKQTAYRNLIAVLDNETKQLHPLVIEDDVNGQQWYMNVRPFQATKAKGWVVKVIYDVPSRMWRKANTGVSWSVTSSPATKSMSTSGNKKTLPKFRFKWTAVRADGFLWRKWVAVTNPNTDRGFSYYGLCLTHSDMDTRPWVKDTANYVQINNGAGITNVQTTIPYDTLTGDGTLIGTYGMGYIDDGVNQEQISWTGRTGTNSGNLTGVTRGIGGTTARAFADNVKIYLSRMKADGTDLRYYVDDLEQNIWIQNPNSATTRIWHVARQGMGIALELGTAVAGSGAISELNFKVTTANRTALSALPESGVVKIDNEAFHFTSRDPVRFSMVIDARNINDTSMGAHSVGASVIFIEHDCWLYCGNPNLTAQVTDDTRKPIVSQTTSDNTTRDYTEFGDSEGLRANAWKSSIEQTSYPRDKASKVYTGNHLDETADPFTEMGMLMQSIYKNGTWRYEAGDIIWSVYEPAGIDRVVSWVYESYRSSVWPQYAKLEKSKDGIVWEAVSVVTSPASAGSWGSPVTVGPYTMGTGYKYLRVRFYGTQNAGQTGGVGYYSALETNSLKYETVSPLTVSMGSWNTNSYEINGQMLNAATGHYFKLVGTIKLNEEIEVDCAAKTVKTLSDGKPHRSMLLVPNTQANWMEFQPGENPMVYSEGGVTGLTITTSYDDVLVV